MLDGGYTFTGADSIAWKNNFSKEDFVSYLQSFQIPNPGGCAAGSSGVCSNQEGWDTFYAGCADQWYDLCVEFGLDPVVVMSWSVNESGWGTSNYANNRGNLLGWAAYTHSPDNAVSGSGNTKVEMAMDVLRSKAFPVLKEILDDPTGNFRYELAIKNGGGDNPDLTTIHGTAYWYCTDDLDKANSIALSEGWIAATVANMKTIFGDFISQYASQSGLDPRIGAINLSGDNAQIMSQLLNEAIRIADDDAYTYSQENRYGEFQYDCSSFVARLFNQFFGLQMPSTTFDYGDYSQYYIGTPDSVELQPGDVLWKSTHVVIYIGNGQDVEAMDTVNGIKVTDYNPNRFTAVYRFVQ